MCQLPGLPVTACYCLQALRANYPDLLAATSRKERLQPGDGDGSGSSGNGSGGAGRLSYSQVLLLSFRSSKKMVLWDLLLSCKPPAADLADRQ